MAAEGKKKRWSLSEEEQGEEGTDGQERLEEVSAGTGRGDEIFFPQEETETTTPPTHPNSFDWSLQTLSLLPRVRPLWWLKDNHIDYPPWMY